MGVPTMPAPDQPEQRRAEAEATATAPVRQWPDHICSGFIEYGVANNYVGFYLADVSHGIPTIGAVQAGTVSGTRVNVFNYPGQTEDIARRLVAAWNASVGVSTEELEARAAEAKAAAQ